MVHQSGIFLLQTDHSRGLAADDPVSLASQLAQFSEIPFRKLPGGVQVASSDECHSRGVLVTRDIDGNVVVFEDANQCGAEFGIVVVGKMVNEVDDRSGPCSRSRPECPPARQISQERSPGQGRQPAFSMNSQEFLDHPSGGWLLSLIHI